MMWVGDLERIRNRVEFRATWSRGEQTVYVEVPDDVVTSEAGDALLTASLLPAMSTGDAKLDFDGPVDGRLLRSTETIQDVILSWDLNLHPQSAEYRRVETIPSATTKSATGSGERGVACFFTGGVDSFYSVIKNQSEIDALIYVHGFDIALENGALYDRVVEHICSAADSLDLPLILMRTNIREFGETTGAEWPDYHGAALAMIAHLLGPMFERVLIPSSWGFAHLKPHGSHPFVDPLWSSDSVEIVHDGAEKNRLGKLRFIAASRAAQAHLRVCYRNPNLSYNCGVCDKCVRTGVAAEIAGVSEDFVTLPRLSAAGIARTRITDGSEVTWRDYHDDLTRSGERPDIRRAIETALTRQRITEGIPGRTLGHRVTQAYWAKRYPRAAFRRALSKLR